MHLDLRTFSETTTTKLQVTYPPVHPHFGSTLTFHSFLVNDVVVHPNQGELISCDQAGRIKQWDLSENTCTHELVSHPVTSLYGH
jgi:G protein beta subunit-like protein